MKNGAELARFLTRRNIEQLSDYLSFRRGKSYFARGRVERLSVADDQLTAVVRGTSRYHVELEANEKLSYKCSCPVGNRGRFCKHCVAAGLAWLASARPGRQDVVSNDEIRAYLLRQDVPKLTELIMTQANGDPEFRPYLELHTRACRPGGIDTGLVERAIADATEYSWYLGSPGTDRNVKKLRRAFDLVRLVSDTGDTAGALELARFALERLAQFVGGASWFGRMWPVLCQEALDLHLTLCRATRPDEIELARWLFDATTSSHVEAETRLRDYAPLLGTEGLAEFRKLAHEAWNEVPIIRANEHPRVGIVRKHRRYGPVMLAIAELSGNPDDLINVWERDLSSSDSFLKIARLYSSSGRRDLAIEWAERGLKAFDYLFTAQLRRMLVDEYLAAGRMNDALNLVWQEFVEAPYDEERYRELKRIAEKAEQWPVWREEALELLRSRAEGAERKGSEARGQTPGSRPTRDRFFYSDRVVQIQLAEGDVEGAWRSGRSVALSEPVLIKLAQARAKARPLDAALVFQELAERFASDKNGRSYKIAGKLLLRAARLYKRARMQDGFAAYLARFRAEHERKRSLMRLLDATRWP